jgi:hypothetical protein
VMVSYQIRHGFSSVFSIRVKRAPKPVPVKRRPLAAFISREFAVPLVYIFVSSHVLAHVANAAPSQATVEIHHAALSSLPQPLRLPPRVSIASFPRVQQVSPRPQHPPTYPNDWLVLPRPTGLALMTTAKMMSTITLRPAGEASLHASRAKTTGGRLYHYLYYYLPFRRQCELWSNWRTRTTTSPITKILQPSTMQVTRFLHTCAQGLRSTTSLAPSPSSYHLRSGAYCGAFACLKS